MKYLISNHNQIHGILSFHYGLHCEAIAMCVIANIHTHISYKWINLWICARINNMLIILIVWYETIVLYILIYAVDAVFISSREKKKELSEDFIDLFSIWVGKKSFHMVHIKYTYWLQKKKKTFTLQNYNILPTAWPSTGV